MDNLDKIQIDILYKEFNRISGKLCMVDEWIYKTLSIGIIPYLIFFAYTLFKSDYQIFIIGFPFLSIFGIILMFNFMNHYQFCETYRLYLTKKLNKDLNEELIIDHKFTKIFYTSKKSIVTFSFIITFFIITVLNIIAFPFINNALKEAHNKYIGFHQLTDFVIGNYWFVTIFFIIFIVASCCYCVTISNKKAKEYLREEIF